VCSAEALKELGVSVDFNVYEGLDHGATPDELAKVRK
jgi:acetyl esterase/lipase